MIATKPTKGHLLIAEPTILNDVSFNRSVVLLVEHNQDGSVGFIMNKPLSFNISELIEDIKVPLQVFNGGPVEQENLYFIHTKPELIPDSILISNGIYWGGDFQSVKDLLNNGKIRPHEIKFFLGYSGWDNSQLDSELKSNSWVVVKNSYKTHILEPVTEHFWKEQMLALGGDYKIWSNAPENPSYN
ncbi:MAG: YqgE/AlgH family protein [Flavobacteriaceae bacterium]|nr:YqgE/AlgH family protein [Flavobacteriaceae bacterium]